jgi:hypothetical protein
MQITYSQFIRLAFWRAVNLLKLLKGGEFMASFIVLFGLQSNLGSVFVCVAGACSHSASLDAEPDDSRKPSSDCNRNFILGSKMDCSKFAVLF